MMSNAFSGNPAMQQQMSAMMPQLLQQMQNPHVQTLMTNPEALQAIQQIQQGWFAACSELPSNKSNGLWLNHLIYIFKQ